MKSPLSLFLVLAATLLSFSQAQTLPLCNSSYLDIYSVISSQNVNPGQKLLNITTIRGVEEYRYTLPTPYTFSQLNIVVGLPSNQPTATFRVTFNGLQSSRTYHYNSEGTVVILAPFRSQGTETATNTIQIDVTNFDELNNPTCHLTDVFYIINPAAFPAGVAGDPMFVGLRGQKFQVHGIDGAVYNLISDENAQVNARFAFLNGPRPCPIMPSTSLPSRACWSHPGSYLGELGLQTAAGDRIVLVAGDAVNGFESLTLNDQTINIGSSSSLRQLNRHLEAGSVVFNSTHEVTIKLSVFELVIENIDGFLNLREVSVSAAEWRWLKNAHGLLGQTWQNKRYSGSVKEIEGEVDDYTIQSGDLMGSDFMFNRFHAEQ